MKDTLKHYLNAGHSCLFIKTPEEIRVQQVYKEIVDEFNEGKSDTDLFNLYSYDVHQGLINMMDKEGGAEESDPVEALHNASKMQGVAGEGQVITIFSDFHVFIEEGGASFSLHVKRASKVARLRNNFLIFVGCREIIPPEIEHEITVVEFGLPDRSQLEQVVLGTAADAGLERPDENLLASTVGAVQGLTMSEASDALALSLVKHKRFVPADIALEKAKQINKSGLMKVVSGEGSLDDIGGLEIIKEWVQTRKDIFNPAAKLAGAKPAKGVLTIGVPGSGKSLLSRVLGNVFGIPVLKVNMGSIFGSLVGQSEENVRKVKQTAIAMAPCIFEIDEIDKGLGSAMTGVSTDSGTTDRVIQDLLSWMAEDHEGVFVSATANDPKKMAGSGGALIRKGRFDEKFFFDFPTTEERKAIFMIHINKRSRLNPDCPNSPIGSADDVDLDRLAELSRGHTGAEIEAAVADALTNAWHRQTKQLDTFDFEEEIQQVNPISESHKHGIDEIRKWAAANCRPASIAEKEDSSKKERSIRL